MKQLGRQLGLDASKFDQCTTRRSTRQIRHLALGEQRQINDADVHHRIAAVREALFRTTKWRMINDVGKGTAGCVGGGDWLGTAPLPQAQEAR
jgi:hypothetical protein